MTSSAVEQPFINFVHSRFLMLLSETLTIMDNVKTAEFVLRGASGINCLFSDVEVGGIRFRCVNGVLVGEFKLGSEDSERAWDVAWERVGLLVIALSLVSGCGFETCCVSVDSCMVVRPNKRLSHRRTRPSPGANDWYAHNVHAHNNPGLRR